MNFSVIINNRIYQIKADSPIHISIPLDFNGAQPNAYGVEKATSKACEAGDLIGDTRRGGSCNFEQISLIPHCNGTHTESIGHITRERISIHNCLRDAFIPATLISVEPENAILSGESYSIEVNELDRFITKKSLENALKKADKNWLQALIIRTVPNDDIKIAQTYKEEIPPFFSTDAMQFIVGSGVKHLLVDLPSIDRIFDEGKLSNHRIFWNIEQGEFEINSASLTNNTITELIFVPEIVADGSYILNLQTAALVADAAPSRPILFKVFE